MNIRPHAPPKLDLPKSNKTVRVRAIDTTTNLVCDSFAFVQPVIPLHKNLNLKTMCFLIEHESLNQKQSVLFDCGARKDYWNGSPQTQRMIGGHVPGLRVDMGVDEVLEKSGFDLKSLNAIIWSHWHWDHIGDGSAYPAETDIVVGPGFKKAFLPGWPHNPDSYVLASDLEGHSIYEPDFTMNIGGFPAHDYFKDGSFYLLDVPGHAVGHICGLARTTPDTFVFLGGDCCHFAGMFRPTPYKPMPPYIPVDQLDSYYQSPCPCSAFTQHHRHSSSIDVARCQPFYQVSSADGSAYSFPEAAQSSIDKLQVIDADENILICLAHDEVLFTLFPIYNENPAGSINDWKERGYKERARWYFLNELPKGRLPGRAPLVNGLQRGEKTLTWTQDTGFQEAA